MSPTAEPPSVEIIVQTIADRIASGALRTGSKLPSQAEMTQEFDTSRHAVRRAMDVLERRGLVRGRQGSGIYVAGRLIDYYVKSRTRYNENVESPAQTSRMDLLDLQEKRVSPELARELSLSPRARVFDLHLLRWTGRDPLCVARHYFPINRFPDLPQHLPQASGITDLIRRMGIADVKRSDTAISARHPTRSEAGMLQIPMDSPVVVLEGRNVDTAGRPVEISDSIWPASRIRVHV